MGRNKKRITSRSDQTVNKPPVMEEKQVSPSGDGHTQEPIEVPIIAQSPPEIPPVTDEVCDSDPLLCPPESLIDNENLEETVDILGNGQLIKKVIDKGLGRETRPSHGDSVEIGYKGWLEDGTQVEEVPSISFVLGDGDVIQAFDLAVPLAECKECFELSVDPRFAYGSRGREPDVPSDAKLRYMVTLVSVSDPPSYATMENRERINQADMKRERGNYYFKQEQFAFAVNSYNKALTILTTPREGPPDSKSEKDRLEENDKPASTDDLAEDLAIRVENNLAAAQLKIQAYEAAIRSCDVVLRKDPDNFKALFRKGKALLEQSDLDQAIPVLKKVQAMVPTSPIVNAELQRARALQQRERERWSRAASRMFPELAKSGDRSASRESGVKSLLLSRRTLLLITLLTVFLAIGLAWFYEAIPKQWIPYHTQ